MKKSACLLSLALLGSGCASPEGFLINDQRQLVAQGRLNSISAAWTNDAASVFQSSRTDPATVAWIVNLIAVSESQGTAGLRSCTSLTAQRLVHLPVKPFKILRMVPEQAVAHYAPREYNEAWFVNACGTMREWRVFDDPEDTKNPLTVILWNANEVPPPRL